MSFSIYMEETPCPTCNRSSTVWSWSGMTYNLAPMFIEAGFYNILKDTMDGEPIRAEILLPYVEMGFNDMQSNSKKYCNMEPNNGWGSYNGALEFTKSLLNACQTYPTALVTFSG